LYENFFTPSAGTTSAVIDHLDFGLSLDVADYDLTPLGANVGTIPHLPTLGDKSVDVTGSVEDDLLQARTAAQFRLMLVDQQSPQSGVRFDRLSDPNPPELVVVYRNR
jgi:hypothetical protein